MYIGGDSSLIQESLISIFYIIISSDMEENRHSKEVALLGGVALLAWLKPYWRECVTVEAGFEVSYAQVTSSVSVHFLLPLDRSICKDTQQQHYVCLHATFLSIMTVMD